MLDRHRAHLPHLRLLFSQQRYCWRPSFSLPAIWRHLHQIEIDEKNNHLYHKIIKTELLRQISVNCLKLFSSSRSQTDCSVNLIISVTTAALKQSSLRIFAWKIFKEKSLQMGVNENGEADKGCEREKFLGFP